MMLNYVLGGFGGRCMVLERGFGGQITDDSIAK